MTTELFYLALVSVFTALMWIPYTLNMISVRGLADAVGYPESLKPLAAWATRMKAAHANAVENLIVFAALVLVANAVGVSDDATQVSSMVYFWMRLVHFLAYTFAIPWVRTLSFIVASLAQICIGWQILVA